MIPGAILIIAIAAAIGLWLISHKVETSSETSNLKRDVADLQRQVKALREAIDDLLIGHVDEPRLRRALSRIFQDEADAQPTRPKRPLT